MGIESLAHANILQIFGASPERHTTRALQKDCEEPHHGINALLPVEAQSNVHS